MYLSTPSVASSISIRSVIDAATVPSIVATVPISCRHCAHQLSPLCPSIVTTVPCQTQPLCHAIVATVPINCRHFSPKMPRDFPLKCRQIAKTPPPATYLSRSAILGSSSMIPRSSPTLDVTSANQVTGNQNR